MSKLKIKINNVNNLSDARYCAGMQADYLGFTVVAASDGYTDASAYKDITQWIEGPQCVLECEDLSAEALGRLLPHYEAGCVETTQISLVADLVARRHQVGLKRHITQDQDMAAVEALPISVWRRMAYCLLVGERGWWERRQRPLRRLSQKGLVIVGGGVEVNDLSVLQALGVGGVALSAQREVKTGWKDYKETRSVLEHLLEAG